VTIEECLSKLLVDGETFGEKSNNKRTRRAPRKESTMKLRTLSTDSINKWRFLDNSSTRPIEKTSSMKIISTKSNKTSKKLS